MAATREASAPASLDAGAPETLYRKLNPGPGRSAREVGLNQRARLHGAFVEIVGERGYDAVTVRELARLAGVSTRTFYEHFECKEDCLLRTYELVVQRAAAQIAASQQGERDWRERLRLAFRAFAQEVERKPQAARLALVDAFAAGPAAFERIQHAQSMFEAMISESFARAPDGVVAPPLFVKGIVAGMAEVARARLLSGREEELPGLADELLEWALCYRCDIAAAPQPFGHRLVPPPPAELDVEASTSETNGEVSGDERALVLAAVAKLAVAKGYWQLTVPRIRAAAGVSRKSFDANFDGVDDCFIAALELHASNALSHSTRAYAEGRTWSDGIYRGLVALCERIAHDPVLTRFGFVEIFSLGEEGMRCRARLITSITKLFRTGVPPGQRPSELTTEASVAAIWGVLNHHIVSGQAQQLPRLAPTLSLLALAPSIGAPEVATAIREGAGPLPNFTTQRNHKSQGRGQADVEPRETAEQG